MEQNDIEGSFMWSQTANTVIFLLCTVLAISLIVIAFLIYAIKKNKCDCCNAAVALHKNSVGQKSQQRHEDMLVYSAVVFTMMKNGGPIKDAKAAKRERIYAAVKAFGVD
ncbi:uncharacterized protein LOC108894468 [Lates japonicus]